MKNIKQIREDQISLSENVESSSDVRKLSMLVRAGLFDPNKLTMLKRALNKDNVKMTRAERDALLELLDRLLTTVMANQGTFMKVKQSIQEELSPEHDGEFSMARSDLKTSISSAQRILDKLNGEGKLEAWLQSKITLASDYLSSAANYVDSGEAELKEDYEEYNIENLDEGSKIDVDINQIPALIIMKRRAIRVFPDGQKVALYWADRINKYISVPFQSIGISEETLGEAKKTKKSKDDIAAYYRRRSATETDSASSSSQLRKDLDRNKTLKGALKTAYRDSSGSFATRLGATLGGALYNRRQASGAKARVAKTRSSAGVTALRKRAEKSSTLNPARMSAVKTLTKSHTAAAAGVGHSESFYNKLAMIREQREIDENALKLIGAVGGAVMKSAAGKAVLRGGKKLGVSALRGGKKLGVSALRGGKRLLRKVKSFGLGALAGGAGGDDENSNDKPVGSQKIDLRVQRPDSVAFKGTSVAKSDPYKEKRTRDFEKSASQTQNESAELLKNLKVISEGSNETVLNFIDGTINVSPSVAAKIVETYNALNVENKKVVQEMINRDKNSFMKFANFASSK